MDQCLTHYVINLLKINYLIYYVLIIFKEKILILFCLIICVEFRVISKSSFKIHFKFYFFLIFYYVTSSIFIEAITLMLVIRILIANLYQFVSIYFIIKILVIKVFFLNLDLTITIYLKLYGEVNIMQAFYLLFLPFSFYEFLFY